MALGVDVDGGDFGSRAVGCSRCLVTTCHSDHRLAPSVRVFGPASNAKKGDRRGSTSVPELARRSPQGFDGCRDEFARRWAVDGKFGQIRERLGIHGKFVLLRDG